MKNLALALCAGLVGGAFAHYALLQLALQSATPTPRVVAAQNFMILDAQGKPAGVFAVGMRLAPSIALYDAQGREIWRATNSTSR